MFILEPKEVKSAMFAKGLKVETNLKLWHKRISHINLQKLQNMQLKGVIIRIPNFKTKEIKAYAKHANSESNNVTHSRKSEM